MQEHRELAGSAETGIGKTMNGLLRECGEIGCTCFIPEKCGQLRDKIKDLEVPVNS